MTDRTAAVARETAETDVEVTLDLDGDGDSTVDTGVGFLDHMLDSFATHGLFDLTVTCEGDLVVDEHHTVEDVAITLGEALEEALGDKRGIVRFADRKVPWTRPSPASSSTSPAGPTSSSTARFSQGRVGGLTSTMAEHFCRSLAHNAGLTLHVEVSGENAHHEIEALFRGLARSLDDATRIDTSGAATWRARKGPCSCVGSRLTSPGS